MIKESAIMKDEKVEIEKKRDESNNNNCCLHIIDSTIHFNYKINNVFMITLYHLYYLHIIYIIYNIIYTHYN